MVADTNLAYWQERLETHFRELSIYRQNQTPARPIFALEHGLDAAEVRVLAATVRAHITDSPPSWKHSLAWVVYATEIGYRYSGDEYWQTFEQETPGWTTNGDRYWIRRCYKWFQKEFYGVVPRGIWASHFSIICWPITHAILPRDLQRQLARILYELRHSFSAELLESPSALGNLIVARSWNASSRFQNFAEEKELAGQIASALLLQGELGTDQLLHQAALQRIAEDLERERQARDWLRGARRFAKERAHVRGLGLLGRDTKSSSISRPEEARAEVAELGIEPRLVLRPMNSSYLSWQVSLEIPNLSHLLLRFPRTRDILTGSRCAVAGAMGTPLARGRCLHSTQRVALSIWPHSDEVLLRFEQPDAQLDYLLRTECLLRPGPTWLFRIASDGLAYECRSLRVRPGERYIIASTAGPISSESHTIPIGVSCEGVHGAILNLPQALTEDWEETLRRLGLGQAKTVEVWPAGLSAVVWDGEGRGEWLASESPCLGIRTDYPLASLIISMGSNTSPSLELTSVEPGDPVFVELPNLPVGLHTVHVSARSSLAGQTESLGDLDVVMRIREARPWSPGVSPHGPLIVQMEPAVPTLEQFWEGRIEVTIKGPADRDVNCRVSLFERDDDVSTVTKKLPPMRLPVAADAWRSHFEKNFRKTKDAENSYDTARICEVEFQVGELGAFTVRCEREFTPLRWIVRRQGHGYFVRLLDDSGDEVPPEVTRLAYETPCIEEKLELASKYDVPESGGMYVARISGGIASVIVPPVIHGLADLKCTPRIERETGTTAEEILRSLKIACLWNYARLSGDFISAVRRGEVLLALVRHVAWLFCGDHWAKAEAAASNETELIALLKGAISKRPEERAIGVVLARDYDQLAVASLEERVRRMASLAMSFHLFRQIPYRRKGDEDWISELALRLSSDLVKVESWAGDILPLGLTQLMEVPTLVRAARFLVLATDCHLRSRSVPGELYAGWEWA